MLRRELLEATQDRSELQPVLHDRASVASDQRVDRIDIDGFAAKPIGPLAVEPQVLRDPKHPTVEPRPGLPFVPVGQSTGTRLLHKIVTLICISRQGICKPGKARQEGDHSLAKIVAIGFTLRACHITCGMPPYSLAGSAPMTRSGKRSL
jgi:hypothetical protein